jgi:hypothetical protein
MPNSTERCSFVQQQLNTLAGGQLAARVLRLDALVAAALLCASATFIECFEDMLHGICPNFGGGRRPLKNMWAAF